MRQGLILVMMLGFAGSIIPQSAALSPGLPPLLIAIALIAAIAQALVGWRDDAAYTAQHFRSGSNARLVALVPVLFIGGLVFWVVAQRDMVAAIALTVLLLGAMALCLVRAPDGSAVGCDSASTAGDAADSIPEECRIRARWIHRTQLLMLTAIGLLAMAQVYALLRAPTLALSVTQFSLAVAGAVLLALQGVNSLAVARRIRNPNRRRTRRDRWTDLLPWLLFLVGLTAFLGWFLGRTSPADGAIAFAIGGVLIAIQLVTMVALANQQRDDSGLSAQL